MKTKGREEDHAVWTVRCLTSVLTGGMIAFGVSLLILTLASVAVSKEWLSADSLGRLAIVASAIGGFAGGLYAALCCRVKLLLCGLAVGAVYALIWMTVGLLLYGGITPASALPILAAALCGGGGAGILCPSSKKRRKC